ncbi:MAG: hypothetical protein ACXWEY_04320 [Bacteroidia bacterium]
MKQLNLWALGLVLFISFSCNQKSNNTSDDSSAGDTAVMQAPAEEEHPHFNDANIEKTEVMQQKGRDSVFVIVHGTFSTPCEHFGDVKQEVDGNNIKITLATIIPPGVNCPEMKVPMHHSIAVNTSDLKPGKYNVDINGQKTSFVKE